MHGLGKHRQIVDENDQLIGHKWRDEFDSEHDIYRVSALWLTNSAGQILLAQRSPKKKNGGGLWEAAVAGTLEDDETYEQNIVKETEEEIGLTGLEITHSQKIFYDTPRKFFCMFFYAVVDQEQGDFKLEDEVAAVQWVEPEWLKKDVVQNPQLYVPGLGKNLETIMKGVR